MAQNFTYNGFETEQQNECVACSETIINPICHNCLAEQLEVWLAYYPDLKKKLVPKIKDYVKNMNNSIVDATQCITCQSKKAAMCNYCFVDFILTQLKKVHVHNSIIGEFLRFFKNGDEKETEE